MRDKLSDGQKFRIIIIVDVYSHEGLANEVDYRLITENIIEILNCLVRQLGMLKFVFVDNGAEFTGHLVDL